MNYCLQWLYIACCCKYEDTKIFSTPVQSNPPPPNKQKISSDFYIFIIFLLMCKTALCAHYHQALHIRGLSPYG